MKPFSHLHVATMAKRFADWRMPRFPHEPADAAAKNRNHSLERAIFRSAALLAERLLCRTAVDRRSGATLGRAGHCLASGTNRRWRWRRRRGTLARPDHGDCRPHEALGRPSVAKAHDGGDGAAGL